MPAYASTAELGTPQDRAELARRYREEGFRAIKLRLRCETLAEDLALVDSVRATVPDMTVMVDANQATTLPSPEPGPVWDYQRALQLSANDLHAHQEESYIGLARCYAQLGKLKARELTKRQLIAFLDSIVDRGAPITANRVYALLKQLFDWAAAKDLIPASPMAGIERPGGAETPRKRVLTTEEIKAFWVRLDTAEMAEPTRLALKLLLVTAQRRGELTFAKWAHFDLDGKIWTIPVELLKSSHSRRESPEPHVVPLSDLALDLLRKVKAVTGEGMYVLPQRLNSKRDRSYSERVLSRAVRQNAKHFGINHFTPHDLRRTAASFMTKLGVPRLHVEKVLNHSTGDIAEVYDRHDYQPEKRAALEKWAAHLQMILDVENGNVIPLSRVG